MLNQDIVSWLKQLPRSFELIVGIPRSGLLAANLLALHANLPLTDLEGIIHGRVLQQGRRKQISIDGYLGKKRDVLVVDDSVSTGQTINNAKAMIENACLPHRFWYACPYVAPGRQQLVDFWFAEVPKPRVFEWNIMHHSVLQSSCVAMDSVLCCGAAGNDDEDSRYEDILAKARPLIIPSKRIGWMVSCLLERHRRETEAWLKRHHVLYDHLIMLDLPKRESAATEQLCGRYKADVYRKTCADLFIEGGKAQAQEIAIATGWSVLCTDTGQMLNPHDLPWLRRMEVAADELDQVIPRVACTILVDDNALGQGIVRDRKFFHCLERDGQYGGRPPDSRSAISEIERLRKSGGEYVVFAWPAFWWLSCFRGMAQHLQLHYHRIFENDRLVVFDLTKPHHA